MTYVFDFAPGCAVGPNSGATPPAGGNYQAVLVTLPDGTQYMPVTTVKNKAQATQLGVPLGSDVPILVPPSENPQGRINDWTGNSISNNPFNFAWTWRPASLGGPNDFKSTVNPIYDAYGNFAYGATGQASGQFISGMLPGMGDVLHGGTNNPINTRDIQSGVDAVINGGVIITVPVHYP